MYKLDPSTLSGFMERFDSLNDAVIQRIEHFYATSSCQQTCLTLSGWDHEVDAGRSDIVIVIDGVSEIVFREGKSTRQVLSDGLTVAWIDGSVWCDFSPYTSEPASLDDLRRSDFYVVGKSLTWRTEDYSRD